MLFVTQCFDQATQSQALHVVHFNYDRKSYTWTAQWCSG